MSLNPILQTQIATLNREDVMGNMHYATMIGYYAQLLGQTEMFYNKLDEMYMVIDPVTSDGAYLISGMRGMIVSAIAIGTIMLIYGAILKNAAKAALKLKCGK